MLIVFSPRKAIVDQCLNCLLCQSSSGSLEIISSLCAVLSTMALNAHFYTFFANVILSIFFMNQETRGAILYKLTGSILEQLVLLHNQVKTADQGKPNYAHFIDSIVSRLLCTMLEWVLITPRHILIQSKAIQLVFEVLEHALEPNDSINIGNREELLQSQVNLKN